MTNGFYIHAPEFYQDKGGYNAAYFSELAQLEEINFWFRARNELILWALKQFGPGFQSLFEIGCGTGFVLWGINKMFHGKRLFGSDVYIEGLTFAAKRLPNATFMQMDARQIPYFEEFDVVAAFDVLEHIDEDEYVLSAIHEALKPAGLLLVTVPQHMWLWSRIDESACHVRRYTANDLIDKIQRNGFRILHTTSFVTTLLPLMIASRVRQQYTSPGNYDAMAELKLHPDLNNLLYQLLSMEISIITKGVNLPMGGSRLAVAKKQ
jgi:SAM-dependent methyltransferase